ncbi:hypothetical protein CHLNCDRAFT_50903 [Chlorella variabilis]|uniref:U2A'/phosphoprotein 32 family A C-terminal domain-containing protein n=1 Tax=Chlorella variabilis TaxID=554065 RepID=E1Z8R9_CHLVA|nr:hypothetical protein CHLNCDRAFT_50903 [Chlorella variabilis]EFN57386.1 hypothetical protein CHLNCDRAFT_50903 [Chlorella variabilis]|eukprot:XP_005849488.1 hypothetical protein CHLNCDRAFT_50903 [Chlorella variabilis]
MVKLTPALVEQLAPGQSRLEDVTRLDASAKEVTEVVDLALCSKLVRLDLSKNSLTSLDGVSMNTGLRWLSAAGNELTSLGSALKDLTNLEVLNVGRNQIAGKVAVRLPALKALILNENRITLVGGLEKCRELNTLVLSHNAVASLGSWLGGCPKLEKLSCSHNQLQELGAALKGCPMLTELRLNHNQIHALPAELASNTRLRILDIGGNPIASFDDIQVLSRLPQLRSVSLKGCPLASAPGYREGISALLPRLEILDTQRIAERPRKQLAAAAAAAAAGAAQSDERGGAAVSNAEAEGGGGPAGTCVAV